MTPIFEHAFGRPPEQSTASEDLTMNAVEARSLTWTQLQFLAGRVFGELRAGETEIATTRVVPVTVSQSTAESAPALPPRAT